MMLHVYLLIKTECDLGHIDMIWIYWTTLNVSMNKKTKAQFKPKHQTVIVYGAIVSLKTGSTKWTRWLCTACCDYCCDTMENISCHPSILIWKISHQLLWYTSIGNALMCFHKKIAALNSLHQSNHNAVFLIFQKQNYLHFFSFNQWSSLANRRHNLWMTVLFCMAPRSH